MCDNRIFAVRGQLMEREWALAGIKRMVVCCKMEKELPNQMEAINKVKAFLGLVLIGCSYDTDERVMRRGLELRPDGSQFGEALNTFTDAYRVWKSCAISSNLSVYAFVESIEKYVSCVDCIAEPKPWRELDNDTQNLFEELIGFVTKLHEDCIGLLNSFAVHR